MTKEKKKIRNTDKDERMENPINLQKEKDKNEFFLLSTYKKFSFHGDTIYILFS